MCRIGPITTGEWYNPLKEEIEMTRLIISAALSILICGCNTMTSPQSTFERGEIVNHGIFDDAIVVAQVSSL